MAKVFICYRSKDNIIRPKDLKERLSRYIDKSSINYDGKLRAGERWKEKIIEKIEKADVILVLIGDNWETLAAEKINKQEEDIVALEIMEAVKQRKQIIPVLFDQASMPNNLADHEYIKELNSIQAIKINTQGKEDYIKSLGEKLSKKIHSRANYLLRKYKNPIGIFGIVVVVLLVMVYYLQREPYCQKLPPKDGFNIIIDPKSKIGILNTRTYSEMEYIISTNLSAMNKNITPLKGRTAGIDQFIRKNITKKCNADIVIMGNKESSIIEIISEEFRGFFHENFPEKYTELLNRPHSLHDVSCFIFTYLSFINGKQVSKSKCLDKLLGQMVSEQLPIHQASLQISSRIFKKNNKLDSALLTLNSIHEGGFNKAYVNYEILNIGHQLGNPNVVIEAYNNLKINSPGFNFQGNDFLMVADAHKELNDYGNMMKNYVNAFIIDNKLKDKINNKIKDDFNFDRSSSDVLTHEIIREADQLDEIDWSHVVGELNRNFRNSFENRINLNEIIINTSGNLEPLQ
ncbi:MAG: TIR domain-containing protein [Saprospirales bacterium]|nr:MAG: TIR domain-containing protein [Saprospirales bacterium]